MRQQIIDRSQLLQQVNTPGTDRAENVSNPGGGFADTLRTALDQVNEVQGKSEALSAGYQRGEVTDIAQVMLARHDASRSSWRFSSLRGDRAINHDRLLTIPLMRARSLLRT
jgi:flagellar hook-basal body complex protein FliE